MITLSLQTLVREPLTSDTPPPLALASPVQPRRVGRGSTSFAPQACTVHSYTPAAAESTTSCDLPGRPPTPAPQPAHTSGKLPEVTCVPPSPTTRGGLLSGYQEVRRGDKEEVLPRAAMTYDPGRKVAQSPCKRPHVASRAPFNPSPPRGFLQSSRVELNAARRLSPRSKNNPGPRPVLTRQPHWARPRPQPAPRPRSHMAPAAPAHPRGRAPLRPRTWGSDRAGGQAWGPSGPERRDEQGPPPLAAPPRRSASPSLGGAAGCL